MTYSSFYSSFDPSSYQYAFAKPLKKEVPVRDSHQDIMKRMEGLRSRVPRYLFRGWHNESGGSSKLNSTTAIIPAALLDKPPHRSIYDMSLKGLIGMLINHLDGEDDVPTEFSSWAASLNLAMRFAERRPFSSHISIIDTKHLTSPVEIYYVPDLEFLGLTPYGGEYIVHGIVEGEHHRAISYRSFTDRGILRNPSHLRLTDYVPITPEFVETCHLLAMQYGCHFALPVALSLVAHYVARYKEATFPNNLMDNGNTISQGLADLPIPNLWYEDTTITEEIVADMKTPVVKFFIRSMRVYAERQSKQVEEAEREKQEQKQKQLDSQLQENTDLEIDFRPTGVDSSKALGPTTGKNKVTKTKQPNTKLTKQLHISMNRDGIQANGGAYEAGIHQHIHSRRKAKPKAKPKGKKEDEVNEDEVMEDGD